MIGEILAGRSALAVLPTGGGKSLCYQIPALIRPGLGLVVSPLIALMADQVAALQQSGVAAEKLDLSTSLGGTQRRLAAHRRRHAGPALPVARGLDAAGDAGAAVATAAGAGGHRRGALRQPMGPSLPPRVPHAGSGSGGLPEGSAAGGHGHGRRPHPRGHSRRAAPARCPRVRRQLCAAGACFVGRTQAERRSRAGGGAHRRARGPARASSMPERAMGSTSSPPGWLPAGMPALAYHAGLDKDLRTARLEQFLDADAAVMVATIAFGMGVDKPDVRYVIHADPPASIEAYWQEIGRAGRDGDPADGITLYSAADLAWALRRIDGRDVDATGQGRADTQGTPALRHARRHRLPCGGGAALFRRGRGHLVRAMRPLRRSPVAVDATLAAQKALSAVHRLGGRFGRGRVVDHLTAKTKDAPAHEAQMSTFGIGRDISPGWLARPHRAAAARRAAARGAR